ncbi:hypothetical protein ACFE04_012656 [Oxalis oulophora]
MTIGMHICKIRVLNYGTIHPFINHLQSTSSSFVTKHYYATTTTTTEAAPAAVATTTTTKESSFTTSYLVDTCGFSPESALSVSKIVKLKNAQKPDALLNCLREYGFSETQLFRLVRKCPKVLVLDAEKNLSPKFEFLLSKGISRTKLAKVVSAQPLIILRSLEKTMIPFYDLCRSLLKSDDKVSKVFVRCPRFMHASHSFVNANIKHLYDSGVDESKISTLVRIWPSAVVVNTERFIEVVEFVKEKGLKPSSVNFVAAVAAVASLSRPSWEKKVLLFESWGWSKEDILGAFQKHPQCMMVSESKINAVMKFLINEMDCEPSYIAHNPMFVSFSLEKRTIPRCSVIQILLSKGRVKLTCLSSMLRIPDHSFEKKLIASYKEEAPYLLKLYREKMSVLK